MSFFPVKVQTMRVSTSPRGILDLILLSPPLATDAIHWGIEKEPVVKKTCHDIMKTFHRNFRLCEVWFVINMKVVSTAIVPYVRLCKSRWMLHNLFFLCHNDLVPKATAVAITLSQDITSSCCDKEWVRLTHTGTMRVLSQNPSALAQCRTDNQSQTNLPSATSCCPHQCTDLEPKRKPLGLTWEARMQQCNRCNM